MYRGMEAAGGKQVWLKMTNDTNHNHLEASDPVQNGVHVLQLDKSLLQLPQAGDIIQVIFTKALAFGQLRQQYMNWGHLMSYKHSLFLTSDKHSCSDACRFWKRNKYFTIQSRGFEIFERLRWGVHPPC